MKLIVKKDRKQVGEFTRTNTFQDYQGSIVMEGVTVELIISSKEELEGILSIYGDYTVE